MTLETLSVCPVCNNSLFHSFLTVKDYTVSQQEFQLVRCTNCSLTFTNPRPPAETILAYYKSEKYISHTGGSAGLMDRLYRIARNFTLKWKAQIVKSYTSEYTLLDYGCGTGHFLGHLKSNGWKVKGIEPSAEARVKASENATVFESVENVTGTFSIITLWHVLEHIHSLRTTLVELKKRLIPSGTIFIAVPNHKSKDASHYQNFWAAYDVPRHLWHFDKQVMTELLSAAGFKVHKIIPMKLDAYYVSLLSESYQNPQSNFISRYFRAFLQAWKSNSSARKTGEYSSLIYIAKPL
jgi:SAM-dependent methyltransferase